MACFFTIVFGGLLALVFFIFSAIFAKTGKYDWGLGFGALELLSAAASSSAWAWALKVSGKADWFLLGLRRYAPLSVIFWSMFVVGILCVLANLRGLVKMRK